MKNFFTKFQTFGAFSTFPLPVPPLPGGSVRTTLFAMCLKFIICGGTLNIYFYSDLIIVLIYKNLINFVAKLKMTIDYSLWHHVVFVHTAYMVRNDFVEKRCEAGISGAGCSESDDLDLGRPFAYWV